MAMDSGSSTVTEGIRVEVNPFYLPDESMPDRGQYLFGYHITITNESEEPARLISRRWIIIDGDGEREEVRGPGVIGCTPRLEPGGQFHYTSYCPLETEWGTMEGAYRMMRDSGATFYARIGRFYFSTRLPQLSAQLL